jgi:hypothetical protein
MSDINEIFDFRLGELEQNIQSLKKSDESIHLLTQALDKLGSKEFFDKTIAKELSTTILKAINGLRESSKPTETKIDLAPIVEVFREMNAQNKSLSDALLRVTSEKTDNSELVRLLVGMIQKQNDFISKLQVPEYNKNLESILAALTRTKTMKVIRNRHSDEVEEIKID